MITLLLLFSLIFPSEATYNQVRVYDIQSHSWSTFNSSKNKFEFDPKGVRHTDVNGRMEYYTQTSKPTTNTTYKSYYLLTEDKFKVTIKLYSDHLLIYYEGGEEAEFK